MSCSTPTLPALRPAPLQHRADLDTGRVGSRVDLDAGKVGSGVDFDARVELMATLRGLESFNRH